MFWLSAQTPRTISAFVILLCHMQYLAVASPTARVLAAPLRANKVVSHMTRALGGAYAFQFALQELGNSGKDEEEESHDDDEERRGCDVSLLEYCTTRRTYYSTTGSCSKTNILVGVIHVSLCYCTVFVQIFTRSMHIYMLHKVNVK